MDLFTKILENFNIKDYDSLSQDEQGTLRSWVDNVEKAQITLEDVKNGVGAMRQSLEIELTSKRETPTNWLSIACFLIPIVGIIRKWYQDQAEIQLRARLKNLILIETILTRPERARAALDGYVARGKAQVK